MKTVLMQTKKAAPPCPPSVVLAAFLLPLSAGYCCIQSHSALWMYSCI